MQEIIKAQGGKSDVKSTDLKPAKFAWDLKAEKSGKIVEINNKNVSLLAKLLGAPGDKKAGMDIFVRDGKAVKKGDLLATFYGETKYKLSETIDSLEMFPIFNIE